jgi:hypothetical protein
VSKSFRVLKTNFIRYILDRMSQTCKILRVYAVTDSLYVIIMVIIIQLPPLAKFSREKKEK